MNDNTVKANQAGVDPKQKLVNDILYVIGAALFMAIGSLLTWGPFALNCLELGDDLRSSCRMIEQFTCSITMIGAGFLSFVCTRNLPNQASLCFVSLIAGLIMSLVSKYGIHAEIAYYFAVACIGLGEGMLFILWMEVIAKQSIHDMKKAPAYRQRSCRYDHLLSRIPAVSQSIASHCLSPSTACNSLDAR